MLAPFVKPQETIMRYKITQRGVYDGNGNQVAIGETIEAPADFPAWLVGKAEAMPEPENAASITNPKKS
jgi:hypothetical protein